MLPDDFEFTSTFWQDFTIADVFGETAVVDTYRRAFEEWKDNYVYLSELVLVLNWKIWEHYKEGNTGLAVIYNDLWEKTQAYGYNNLQGDELRYFYHLID